MAGGFFGLGRQVDQRIARYIELVASGGGGGVGAHASQHIDGGADPINGDKLEISWSPSNYTPDTTPAEADSTDDLTAHLAALDDIVGKVMTVGSSFPGSPSDGDVFYHTTHGGVFEYSGTTSTWLGEEKQVAFGRSGSNHNNVYLRSADSLGHANRGYLIPYDIYITGWTATWTNTETAGNARIRRNGTNVVSRLFDSGGETSFEAYTITPVAFAGSGRMGLYLQSLLTGLTQPTFLVYYRRSET